MEMTHGEGLYIVSTQQLTWKHLVLYSRICLAPGDPNYGQKTCLPSYQSGC